MKNTKALECTLRRMNTHRTPPPSMTPLAPVLVVLFIVIFFGLALRA